MVMALSLFNQTLASLSPDFGSDLIASLATYLEVPQENIEAHTYSKKTNEMATSVTASAVWLKSLSFAR